MAGRERFIYDDDGEPMRPGSKVLVNGSEICTVDLKGGKIIIDAWPADEPFDSLERIDS
jgi:hypothetical protein